MGSFINKMKNAYCLEHHSKQLLLYNAFQNIYDFQAICVQKLTLFGPKTPLLCNMRPKNFHGQIQNVILNISYNILDYKMLTVFKIFDLDFQPLFTPNLKDQPLFLDVK